MSDPLVRRARPGTPQGPFALPAVVAMARRQGRRDPDRGLGDGSRGAATALRRRARAASAGERKQPNAGALVHVQGGLLRSGRRGGRTAAPPAGDRGGGAGAAVSPGAVGERETVARAASCGGVLVETDEKGVYCGAAKRVVEDGPLAIWVLKASLSTEGGGPNRLPPCSARLFPFQDRAAPPRRRNWRRAAPSRSSATASIRKSCSVSRKRHRLKAVRIDGHPMREFRDGRGITED